MTSKLSNSVWVKVRNMNEIDMATKNSCIARNIKIHNKDVQICTNRYIVGGESFIHLITKLYIAWIMYHKNYTPYFECEMEIDGRRIVVDVCGYKRSIRRPFIVAEIYTRASARNIVDRIKELQTLDAPIIVVAPRRHRNLIFELVKHRDRIIFISLERAIKNIVNDLAIFIMSAKNDIM